MKCRADFQSRGFIAGLVWTGMAVSGATTTTYAQAKSAGNYVLPNIVFALADDWSWPHAGAYGDHVVQTPAFDRLAKEGVLFSKAFCASPSCTPSRGAILTGQAIYRLGAGGNLWGTLGHEHVTYPDLLETAGYTVGHCRKGWGPGNYKFGKRERNPAGPQFEDFKEFMTTVPQDRPFCFWHGSREPHRAYEKGAGLKAGMDPAKVKVPPFLPDTPEVRSDILDYYTEVQRFDEQVREILQILDDRGLAENTIVVMTSDNGMPFPRAKANLYDGGTRMPMAIRWPARFKAGQVIDAPFCFTDFAPTFLEATLLKPLDRMTGVSWLATLAVGDPAPRDRVYPARERHANVRRGNLSYPMRSVRTEKHLYILNFKPSRWPAGDPERYRSGGDYGDIDGSPTKDVVVDRRDDPKIKPFYELACAKRPPEELYDLEKDPWQIKNVAEDPKYADVKKELQDDLEMYLRKTNDPRMLDDRDQWDRYPYFGRQRDWPHKPEVIEKLESK